VHDGVETTGPQQISQAGLVRQIALDKVGARIDRLAVAGREIVEHAYFVPPCEQTLDAMTSDVTRPACDEHAHRVLLNIVRSLSL
jgi:hypothetical protein